MNMQPILLAICTDVGREMLYCSSNFNNFSGCRDKPDDDDKRNFSIVQLSESQISTSRVSSQYAMLCATLPSSGSSSVSTDDVSSWCISVPNGTVCTTPLSCSSVAILRTGRILAKPCRTR